MRKLTELRQGITFWSATLVDGNFTYTAPILFTVDTPADKVLAAIARKSPDIDTSNVKVS